MVEVSLISTTTPLVANDTWTSSVQSLVRATKITGLAFADQPGTLFIEQSGDGINFDLSTSYVLNDASMGQAIEVGVLSAYFRVRFVNGNADQTVFRVFVDIRDPYGEMLTTQTPSAGGAWLVLFYDPAHKKYQVVGRFDGANGWAVNGGAAVSTKKDGKYAAFVIADAVVTTETLQTISEHSAIPF